MDSASHLSPSPGHETDVVIPARPPPGVSFAVLLHLNRGPRFGFKDRLH